MATRVGPGDLAQHQLNLQHHPSVGQGAHASDVEARAVMTARANAQPVRHRIQRSPAEN